MSIKYVHISTLHETRGRRLDAERVDRYSRLALFSTPPPIRVNADLQVLDGHHRLAAARRCGIQFVAVRDA